MGRDPAFLFYPSDYLGGTMGFTVEMHGAYLLVLIFQFNNGPFEEKVALNLVGDVWNDIKKKFTEKDGVFFNIRLKDEQEKRASYCNSRRSNRKHMKNICESYVEHMEDRNRNKDTKRDKRRVQRGEKRATVGFNLFWDAYPKRVARGSAIRAYEKMVESDLVLGAVLKALEWQKRSEDWIKDGGKYVPMPATYLNQERWKDEPGAGVSEITPYRRIG